jgi:hypothetical protein
VAVTVATERFYAFVVDPHADRVTSQPLDRRVAHRRLQAAADPRGVGQAATSPAPATATDRRRRAARVRVLRCHPDAVVPNVSEGDVVLAPCGAGHQAAIVKRVDGDRLELVACVSDAAITGCHHSAIVGHFA